MEHSSKNRKTSEQLVEEAKQQGKSIDAVELLLETIPLEEIEAAKQNEQNEQKR